MIARAVVAVAVTAVAVTSDSNLKLKDRGLRASQTPAAPAARIHQPSQVPPTKKDKTRRHPQGVLLDGVQQ
jgi:hypothetical protein